MIKFIKLTRSVDHEEIYVNPKYISAIFPAIIPEYENPKRTIVKVVGNNADYFNVNESVKEIIEKIEKKKNKNKVKEESDENKNY